MTKQELLKNALPAFKKKFGKTPKKQGLSHCGVVNQSVVFAPTKEACEAYIAAKTLISKSIMVFCFLGLTFVICCTSGIFLGIEEHWTNKQWILLTGTMIAVAILLGYIHFHYTLQLDRLKALYQEKDIVTLTAKELSNL